MELNHSNNGRRSSSLSPPSVIKTRTSSSFRKERHKKSENYSKELNDILLSSLFSSRSISNAFPPQQDDILVAASGFEYISHPHYNSQNIHNSPSSSSPSYKDELFWCDWADTFCHFVSLLSEEQIVYWMPPTTRFSLHQLDVKNFVSNIHLRHALTLNPHQRLSPVLRNAEEQKTRDSYLNDYWKKLETEIDWLVSYCYFCKSNGLSKSKKSLNFRSAASTLINKNDKSGVPLGKIPTSLYAHVGPGIPLLLLPMLINELREMTIILLSPSSANILALRDRLDIESFLKDSQRGRLMHWEAALYFIIELLDKDAIMDERRQELLQIRDHIDQGNIILALRGLLGIIELMKLDKLNLALAKELPAIIRTEHLYEFKYFIRNYRKGSASLIVTDFWIHEAVRKQWNLLSDMKMTIDMSSFFLDSFFLGCMNLISDPLYWPLADDNVDDSENSSYSYKPLPETFFLDKKLLQDCTRFFRVTLIVKMSEMIVTQLYNSYYFSWKDRHHFSKLLSSLRNELHDLLFHKESINTIQDIAQHLQSFIQSNVIYLPSQAEPVGAGEKDKIAHWLQLFLKTDSPVYIILSDRLKKILFQFMKKESLPNDVELISSSWIDYKEFLVDHMTPFRKLVIFNLRTYRSIYNELFKREWYLLAEGKELISHNSDTHNEDDCVILSNEKIDH